MTLIRPTSAEHAATPPRQVGYRTGSELAMRAAVERWGRAKWPEARVCHELVMDRGTVRADVALVSPDHFVVVEIKGPADTADRMMRQVGMFRAAAPEVWIAAAAAHRSDVDLLRFLLPSVGDLVPNRDDGFGHVPNDVDLIEHAPAVPGPVYPQAMLALLWVEELRAEVERHRLVRSGLSRATHPGLVKHMLRLDPDEQIKAVCRQLRQRDAFWRADPPVRAAA